MLKKAGKGNFGCNNLGFQSPPFLPYARIPFIINNLRGRLASLKLNSRAATVRNAMWMSTKSEI